MKKNNRIYRFAAIVLLLTMITLILVSGTYSKYTSSTEGSDNVKVAKWSILVNNKDIANATAQTLTFDLFDTINDTLDHNAEGDVATDLIAPGVAGEFGIDITNQSEVTAKYAIEYRVTNTSSIPIEFSTDGGSTWKASADVANLNVAAYDHNDGSDASKSTELAINGTKSITVKWRWAYIGAESSNYTSAQTDETDTTLGIAAKTTRPEITVNAKVTVTQVN